MINHLGKRGLVQKPTICSVEDTKARDKWFCQLPKILSNDMAVDLYVLSSLMEGIIVSYLECILIVTKNLLIGLCYVNPSLQEINAKHTSFEAISARARYLASVLKWASTFSFLLRNKTKESPKKKQYPIVECWSIGSKA